MTRRYHDAGTDGVGRGGNTLSVPEYPTLFFISKLINESNFLKTTKVKITGGHNSDKCGVTDNR